MRTWISCRLDEGGNVLDVGKAVYRDGHAIKCTMALLSKSGEVARDDDSLKVIRTHEGYRVFCSAIVPELYSQSELLVTEEPSHQNLGSDDWNETGQETHDVELAGAATGGGNWW